MSNGCKQETLNIVQSESRPDGKPINFLNINLALSSIQNTLLHLRCHFQNYQPIKIGTLVQKLQLCKVQSMAEYKVTIF